MATKARFSIPIDSSGREKVRREGVVVGDTVKRFSIRPFDNFPSFKVLGAWFCLVDGGIFIYTDDELCDVNTGYFPNFDLVFSVFKINDFNELYFFSSKNYFEDEIYEDSNFLDSACITATVTADSGKSFLETGVLQALLESPDPTPDFIIRIKKDNFSPHPT